MDHIQYPSQPRIQQRPTRKQLRKRDHDYSQPGYYFVTICTADRRQWFGYIANDEMHLNHAGNIAQSVWNSLLDRFPGLELDRYIVMPNHMHGIIALTETIQYPGSKKKQKPTLSDVIDTFKGAVTHQIHTTISKHLVWQKSFHDEIIRSDRMLDNQRQYIIDNPICWLKDEFFVAGL
jgi:REP element-mobilizing transposase RayT